jgi:hypothetical protein
VRLASEIIHGRKRGEAWIDDWNISRAGHMVRTQEWTQDKAWSEQSTRYVTEKTTTSDDKKTPKPCACGDERGSSVLHLGYILFRSLNAGTPYPSTRISSAICHLPVYRPGPVSAASWRPNFKSVALPYCSRSLYQGYRSLSPHVSILELHPYALASNFPPQKLPSNNCRKSHTKPNSYPINIHRDPTLMLSLPNPQYTTSI